LRSFLDFASLAHLSVKSLVGGKNHLVSVTDFWSAWELCGLLALLAGAMTCEYAGINRRTVVFSTADSVLFALQRAFESLEFTNFLRARTMIRDREIASSSWPNGR
jgi:hypothetical protein